MTRSPNAGMPLPGMQSEVDLSDLGSTRFVLTVDTEEEFDWNGPFQRDGFGLSHVAAIPRFQRLCDDAGVTPCYLIDYPIATDGAWINLLGTYTNEGRAEIGVQLHPWVSPPFSETVNVHNSYACNLPPELEREKLTRLHGAIVENFGVRPDSYRAGRYGAGSSTPDILADLGIAIDTSVRTRFDYSDQGGPDYSNHPINPYWIKPHILLELPVTTVFGGVMRKSGDVLFSQIFGSQSTRSLLARSRMLERIALTPEGIPLEKALEGIDLALEQGVQIINLSLHSPSLAVGHTPYVRCAEELEGFYDWLAKVMHHMEFRGIRPVSFAEIKAAAMTEITKKPINSQMTLASAA